MGGYGCEKGGRGDWGSLRGTEVIVGVIVGVRLVEIKVEESNKE